MVVRQNSQMTQATFRALFEINRDRSYQVEGESDSTSDLIAGSRTPRPQPQPQSTGAFRRFSLPGWVVLFAVLMVFFTYGLFENFVTQNS